MEKFPILCTLSALIVFFGAAIGAAGVQAGKSKDLPFGSISVERIGSSVRLMEVFSGRRQDVAAFGRFEGSPPLKLASKAEPSVKISGDLLVSF